MAANTIAPSPRKQKLRTSTIIRHIVICFFMAIIILPLLWVLLLSVKSIPDAYTGTLWPENFDFTHYAYVFDKIDTLPRNLWNSIFVTMATVFITCFCAILGGYALVHLELPGKLLVVTLLMASLFFPTRVVSLIAVYEIQRQLNLINTTHGLIYPYVTINLAISILIMRGIFQQIPHELIEAASIDGSGPWRTLVQILFPLTANGIVVIVIVNFVSAWGEYLLAATLTNDQIVRTMPVVLAAASGGMGQWAWPRIAAVYVVVVLPGIIIFGLFQRLYFKGMTEGAIKL